MGQSLVKNYVHIVFSTKNREPYITSPHDQELYAYIVKIAKELESPVLSIGGHIDHIHILCALSRKIALMTFVQKVKANSSKWIKSKDNDFSNFFWQEGYGAFSVNPTQIDIVSDYILNQSKHHATKSYQSEYLAFLKQYKIEYDEKYIWQ